MTACSNDSVGVQAKMADRNRRWKHNSLPKTSVNICQSTKRNVLESLPFKSSIAFGPIYLELPSLLRWPIYRGNMWEILESCNHNTTNRAV